MVPINSTFIKKKNTKLPLPWTSKTTKRYKRNTVNGDLHFSKRISSNFDAENPLIKEKFVKADFPMCFINIVVNEFQKGKEYGDERFIISPNLFEITKPFISVEIPYCELIEIKSKHFLKKFLKSDHYLLLLVTFYMVEMENDIVTPSEPIFHHRIVDDIYSR